jgi:hypothetical protein
MLTKLGKPFYSRIFSAAALFLCCAASSSFDQPLPKGAVWFDIVSKTPAVCLGGSAPVQVIVYDFALGIPVGNVTASLSSKLGASDSQLTLGGMMTELTYKPTQVGDDTITVLVETLFSGKTSIPIPAYVVNCGWKWYLRYSGTYPNPKGFWTFYENAVVSEGNLRVSDPMRAMAEPKLEGYGDMKVSLDMSGTNPQMSCALNNAPEATAKVTITGTLNKPGPGSMTISLQVDPVSLPGGSKFQCKVLNQMVDVPQAFPSTTIDLNALGLTDLVLSASRTYASYSREISTAIVWQIPGLGSLTIDLEPLETPSSY